MIPNREDSASETIVELGRLNSLSDSVFAFALTLMVLDVRVPEDALAGDLAANVVALAPKLLIYLISFVVIGGAWASHQRMLGQIKRGDGMLVWLNLFSLLFVTLMPASAGLLGRFPGQLIAVLVFAADVILIQLSALWLWRHASKNGLVNPALDRRVVVGVGRRLSLSAVAFSFTIVLALLNTHLVYIVWIALFALLFTTDWLSWQQALKATQRTIALDGAARGQLEIIHGSGNLNLHADASHNVLVQGRFGSGLDTQITREGDLLAVQLHISKRRGLMSQYYPWAWGSASALDWNLSLNPQIPLSLHLMTGTDQATLDFTDAQLSRLQLEASSSSINLLLPSNAGETAVHIQASSLILVIQIPPGVAARIYSSRELSAMEVEVDSNRFTLVDDGKAYRSSDYDTAPNRVEIQLELVHSSVQII
jgi:uncharacterized membrane protein